MLSRTLTCTLLVATLLMGATHSHASWKRYVDANRNLDFFYHRQGSSANFAMYQNVMGMRFYIFVEGATFHEFMNNMQWTATTVAQNPILNGHPYIGFIAMPRIDGGNIVFNMYASDYFQNRKGEPLRVSFLVLGRPGAGGALPNIDIRVENAIIGQVRVNYGRTRVIDDGQGNLTATAQGATVRVRSGELNPLRPVPNDAQFRGGIGGIMVAGGFVGGFAAATPTISGRGIPVIVSRARRIPRHGIRMGGSIHNNILARGDIRRVVLGGGLGMPNVPEAMGSVRAGAICSGWYAERAAADWQPYPRSINRVITRRGGNNSSVVAGGGPAAADWYFTGNIGNIRIRVRNESANPNLNNCTFVTHAPSRVGGDGTGTATGSWLEFINGRTDISTL